MIQEPTLRPKLARRAALLAVTLAALASGAGAQATFEVHPASPTSTDTVHLAATYPSACFLGAGRADVLANTVRVTAFEGCICPPVLPHPVEVFTTLDPLPAGTYAVDLVAAPDPLDPGCHFDPRPQGSAELVVKPGPELLSLQPAAPAEGDPVTVIVRSGCPFGVEAPSRQGRRVRITMVPSLSLAPCSEDPVFEAALPLGRLPAGDYAVAVTFAEGEPPSNRLVLTRTFRVHPAAGGELLLRDGRFRVRAAWTLANGRTGAASALPLTADSGAFSFFGPDNLEIAVKIVDGCAVNGHYWFFAGGMTHAGVAIEVADAVSGIERLYFRPPGLPFQPISHARAFPCS